MSIHNRTRSALAGLAAVALAGVLLTSCSDSPPAPPAGDAATLQAPSDSAGEASPEPGGSTDPQDATADSQSAPTDSPSAPTDPPADAATSDSAEPPAVEETTREVPQHEADLRAALLGYGRAWAGGDAMALRALMTVQCNQSVTDTQMSEMTTTYKEASAALDWTNPSVVELNESAAVLKVPAAAGSGVVTDGSNEATMAWKFEDGGWKMECGQ